MTYMLIFLLKKNVLQKATHIFSTKIKYQWISELEQLTFLPLTSSSRNP